MRLNSKYIFSTRNSKGTQIFLNILLPEFKNYINGYISGDTSDPSSGLTVNIVFKFIADFCSFLTSRLVIERICLLILLPDWKDFFYLPWSLIPTVQRESTHLIEFRVLAIPYTSADAQSPLKIEKTPSWIWTSIWSIIMYKINL